MNSFSPLTVRSKQANFDASCGLLRSCHPADLVFGRVQERGPPICTRMFLRRGKPLYQFGDPYRSIYTVISGTFKTCTVTEKGKEQVMGFYLRGAILGLDAIAIGHYAASAIAMEDSRVCVVTAECLEQQCARDKTVAKRIDLAMAQEIKNRHRMILTLGRKSGVERVASFVTELAATYLALGYPSAEIKLVMTREEIGSYLGLTFETVSRILSNFEDRQILAVNTRHIRILDMPALTRLAD